MINFDTITTIVTTDDTANTQTGWGISVTILYVVIPGRHDDDDGICNTIIVSQFGRNTGTTCVDVARYNNATINIDIDVAHNGNTAIVIVDGSTININVACNDINTDATIIIDTARNDNTAIIIADDANIAVACNNNAIISIEVACNDNNAIIIIYKPWW